MKDNLEAKYNHTEVEEGKYSHWIEEGYFTAGDKSKDPFTIVIPPPNVTGKLHIGHAWDNTLQDILTRYKRMQGYDALFLPGMDHAGIATQAKIDARLKEQGISRYDLGREEYLKRAWQWKAEYAAKIREQWSKLGNSVDYTRERFTMDDQMNRAVRHVFTQLYNEGLIYRGYRIINWDPEAMTALSNIEVIYQEDKGKMYYFNYKVVETGKTFTIATTRPETMFGDVCVVVHPDDERFKDMIGLHAINPANQESLPIIADSYIDMSFGTGAMKCTPAHDPNDFAIAERHHLDKPICMNPDGTMNKLAGKFEGMDRYKCREEVTEKIRQEGNLLKIEEITHQVGHSERTHCVVEPYLSKQWFVKMKPLAADVLEAQKDPNQAIHFYPERFNKVFERWLENIEDWCISRQLWWGHRIPAWYNRKTGETYVSETDPADIENWTQDEDVLDTWFSSALWPFATLGWPDETPDFKRYYPTDVMVTGYDIIFFWVARMAFQARHFTGQRPFKDVLIHGLIRDEQGRKMSKSLGNGIDPIDVINQYGVDALRFFLTTNSAPGQDMRYIQDKVEASWNFINKIWNASRFVIMNLEDGMLPEDAVLNELSPSDSWIINRLNETIVSVQNNMTKYEFGMVGNELYQFVWNDFCSWYVEMSKSELSDSNAVSRKTAQSVLYTVLNSIVRMLHPFMPFVTEEIYLKLPHRKDSICQESWPAPIENISKESADKAGRLIAIIQTIRETKVKNNLKPSAVLHVSVKDAAGNAIEADDTSRNMIAKMAKAEWVDHISDDAAVIPMADGSLSIPSSELHDIEKEKEQLMAEMKRLHGEIERSTHILNNPGFISKAPAEKIEEEKKKMQDYQQQYNIVNERLTALKQ